MEGVSSRTTVMVVFGTRPEAVKLAPVARALTRSETYDCRVVVTGQHRSMLHQVLDLFGINPDVDLNLITPRQTLTRLTASALEGLSPVIERLRPDAVLVQGDTTTTLAAALAGFYHQVPVVHLEAGLRTRERYSPFPEEINRRVTTQLASLHLAPTEEARRNLLAERVPESSTVVTGNTVIDALRWAVDLRAPYGDPALRRLDTDDRRVLLVTAHRRESWGAPLSRVARALATVASHHPDLLVVLPVHRNPTVREALLPPLHDLENVLVVEPLDYGGFAHLMDRSYLILTDSGGIQEEGPSLGKPVLVMRDTTERPEAVHAGTARVVGTGEQEIVDAVTELLRDGALYRRMAAAVNPYGDGRATARVVASLDHLLLGRPRPSEFRPDPDLGRRPEPASRR